MEKIILILVVLLFTITSHTAPQSSQVEEGKLSKSGILKSLGFISEAPDEFETQAICTQRDERQLYRDIRIARIRKSLRTSRGCTGFLISPKCILTAGHCKKHLGVIEFDAPISTSTGRFEDANPVDQYQAHLVFGYKEAGFGNDWTVASLKPNSITGALPGHRYGYFQLQQGIPVEGMNLRVSGYGSSRVRQHNGSLKTAQGSLTGVDPQNAFVVHLANTRGGDSGSAIVDEATGKVIGIHTHGGCAYDREEGTVGGNYGTLIEAHSELKQAISACLSN